jgi:hypothetical protein
MQKNKRNNIFERLAQSARARRISDPYESRYTTYERMLGLDPRRELRGRPGTLERFADELQMPADVLIAQFSRAGVSLGLQDQVSSSAKDILLGFLRALHGSGRTRPVTLYSHETPTQREIEIVQDVNEELIRSLAVDPTLMYSLNPRKFEEVVAFLFEKRGWQVRLTPPSKDGGFDFFAELKNPLSTFLVLGECKRYSRDRKVGVEIVRGLHSVTETNQAHQGIVITSSFFTAGAVEYQRVLGPRMELKDYSDLVNWLQQCRGKS